MSYQRWISDIKKYTSDLGEDLGEEYENAHSRGPMSIKKYRFKLMRRWLDNAPKNLVIEHLDKQIDRAGIILDRLEEEENRLLDEKRKYELKQAMKWQREAESDSDSD